MKVEAAVLGQKVLNDLGLVVTLLRLSVGQVTVGHPTTGRTEL